MASKSALVVIALKGFQDLELAGTVKGLQNHGYTFDICGQEKNVEAEGKFGGKQLTQVAMRDANVGDYDRIAFIGGPGAKALANDPEAQDLARAFYDADKIVGAICIAPTILATAGLLKGKRATVWDSKSGTGPESKFITEHGGHFIPRDPVVVDGRIVTGNGPDAAAEFGEKFATL